MEIAWFCANRKTICETPLLENLLISPNQNFKINFSYSEDNKNDWTYTYYPKLRIIWPLLTWHEHVCRKILKLAHNWVGVTLNVPKRKIISKFRSSQRFCIALLASYHLPFLHCSLPTAAFLPIRYILVYNLKTVLLGVLILLSYIWTLWASLLIFM